MPQFYDITSLIRLENGYFNPGPRFFGDVTMTIDTQVFPNRDKLEHAMESHSSVGQHLVISKVCRPLHTKPCGTHKEQCQLVQLDSVAVLWSMVEMLESFLPNDLGAQLCK